MSNTRFGPMVKFSFSQINLCSLPKPIISVIVALDSSTRVTVERNRYSLDAIIRSTLLRRTCLIAGPKSQSSCSMDQERDETE